MWLEFDAEFPEFGVVEMVPVKKHLGSNPFFLLNPIFAIWIFNFFYWTIELLLSPEKINLQKKKTIE